MAEEDRRTSSRSIRRTHWIFLSISPFQMHSETRQRPEQCCSTKCKLHAANPLPYLSVATSQSSSCTSLVAVSRLHSSRVTRLFLVPISMSSYFPFHSPVRRLFFYLETDKHLPRSRSNRSSKCNSSDIRTKCAKSVFHTDLIENCTHHHATNPCNLIHAKASCFSPRQSSSSNVITSKSYTFRRLPKNKLLCLTGERYSSSHGKALFAQVKTIPRRVLSSDDL